MIGILFIYTIVMELSLVGIQNKKPVTEELFTLKDFKF
jgi:hypothetical protein